ncbi:class I SAM-dependent methyltransferase [Arenimonas aestuarii]
MDPTQNTAADASARRAAWSAYWATGDLHSCVGSFDGNYSGAIGDFWRGVFNDLPEGPLRALDLATGNGALPRLLWDWRGDRPGLEIDAVDLARLSPTWFDPDRHAGLRFHADVAMEKLPFEDACFDLVASQYGFEYADRDAALAEALRVLKPGGRLALVMHHADSVLVRVGRSELRNQALLLTPDGLLAATAAVLPWIARARAGQDPSGEPEALRAREAYNAAIRAIAAAVAGSDAPDLLLEVRAWVNRLLAGTGPDPAPALAALANYRDGLVAAGLRTGELIGHALDDAQLATLVSALQTARPSDRVRVEQVSQAEGLLGWGLRLDPV